MPKKVQVAQLRVGMFLQGLEGSWLKHPFWRTKFLIRTEAELQKLRECGVAECWIDPSKGEDLAVPLPEVALAATAEMAFLASRQGLDSAPEPAPGLVAAPAEPMQAPATESLPSKAEFAEELERAAGIRERAGAAVAALLAQARQGAPLQIEPCLPVLQEMQASINRNRGALASLMRIKRHDDYGTMHAVAVSTLMVCLARELTLDEASCLNAGLAGLLLDVGKATLPEALLNKPGALSDEEFAQIKTHPQAGHDLLRGVAGVPPSVLEVGLCHHERLDGSGYPRGLSGGDISELARMAAICDVYDAVTSNRPYKHAWDPAEAIARMASWKGPLDSAIFSAFVRCMGIYPTGSLVRLQSERLAVVLEQNPGAQSEPVVRVFFCVKTRQRVSPTRLDLAAPGHDDYIISRETAADWPVGNTEALWSHGYAAKILGAGADAGRATLSGPVRD